RRRSCAPPPASRRSDQQGAFKDEELTLGVDSLAAAIAAERAAGRQHAVAGNEDRQRVAAAGLAHGARSRGERPGEIAIAARLAVGDVAHELPDAQLEGRAARLQRQVERFELAGEIGVKLPLGAEQPPRRLAARSLATPIERGEVLVLLEECEAAERAFEREARHRCQRRAARSAANAAGSVIGSEQTGPAQT